HAALMVTDVSVTAEKRGALRVRAAAAATTARLILRSNAPAMQVARFAGHYVQMSIAMLVGMLLPLGLLLSAFGLGPYLRSPEASALLMTTEMVIGMAAWMAIRRHPWRHTVEMSAGMAASTVVAAVASLAGLLPHTAVDSTVVGLLMWVGMLAAMLFRWRDYAQYGHCHVAHKTAVA
ncbi:MAG TPA: hypothetical protein VKI99_22205, partial [Candidatus Dormibacteraeota bacterium]|nr:hypothetical protein [Candidatus Dormibacteraeota bacterium]